MCFPVTKQRHIVGRVTGFPEDVLGKWGMVKGVICNDGIVVLIRRGGMILILGMPLPAI